MEVDGETPFAKRVPPKTLELWRKMNIIPRGAMLEVMELMNRTHAGMDQDYENLTKQISRTALADGWGGAMLATEISDILFGTPVPVRAEVNMGCLKEGKSTSSFTATNPICWNPYWPRSMIPDCWLKPKPPGPRGSI